MKLKFRASDGAGEGRDNDKEKDSNVGVARRSLARARFGLSQAVGDVLSGSLGALGERFSAARTETKPPADRMRDMLRHDRELRERELGKRPSRQRTPAEPATEVRGPVAGESGIPDSRVVERGAVGSHAAESGVGIPDSRVVERGAVGSHAAELGAHGLRTSELSAAERASAADHTRVGDGELEAISGEYARPDEFILVDDSMVLEEAPLDLDALPQSNAAAFDLEADLVAVASPLAPFETSAAEASPAVLAASSPEAATGSGAPPRVFAEFSEAASSPAVDAAAVALHSPAIAEPKSQPAISRPNASAFKPAASEAMPRAHADGSKAGAPRASEREPSDPIRTRTMARLLAAQGYRSRALSIYDELLAADGGDETLRVEADRLR